MRKLIAVLVVLAALVAALLWWSRRTETNAPLAMDAPPIAVAAPETTKLDPNEKVADTERKLAESPPSPERLPANAAPSGPRARIFGRVVDARETPVAAAEVRVRSRQGPWSKTARLQPNKPAGQRDEQLTTRTDAAGRFSFDVPVPTAPAITIDVVPAPLQRYVALEYGREFFARPSITAGDNDIGDILVGDGAAVTGRVIDEAGQPIVGANLITNIAPGEPRAQPVNSDADGMFTIPNLLAGQRQLTAWAEGRRNVSALAFTLVALETKQLDPIVLAKAQTIAGTVVDEAGQPAEKVEISGRVGGRGAGSSMSDAQGAFSITVSVDAPHVLSIRRTEQWAGFAHESAAKIEYEPGRQDVRLVVKKSQRMTFRVKRASDGSPIERFGLELRRKLPPGSFASPSDTPIEEHQGGSVALAADPATQTLVLEAPGFVPVEGEIVLDEGSSDTQTLTLGAEGRIVGQVFVGDKAASGARVMVSRESWRIRDGSLTRWPGGFESDSKTDVPAHAGRQREELAGEGGAFAFDMLATGTYALTIEAEGGAPTFEREIGVVAGRTTDVGQIQVALGGILRGRFVPPPEESPLGFSIAISAIDVSSPNAIQMRQTTISSSEGRFEFKGLAPSTYLVQWIRPEMTNSVQFSGGSDSELPRAVVTAGGVAEIVLDASNTASCTVAVRVLRRGAPLVGAKIWAKTQVRHQKSWSNTAVGITDAEGRVEGKIEGGLRFRLLVWETERGPLLLDSAEEIEAVPRGRVEREFKVETGNLVLMLPADLVPPEKGDVTISLTSASIAQRNIRVSTPNLPSSDRLEWKGSVIPLVPVAVGTYAVRVSFRRFDVDPNKPNNNTSVDLRAPFTTEIEVRADAETRIEVK